MIDLAKIGAVFVLIVVCLRMRWNLGLVIFAGSLLLGALYQIGPVRQAQVIVSSVVEPETINIVVGLVLIMVLENIIRKRGVLKRMVEAVMNVAQDRRIAMAVLPALIGLLPSAGGAAFSAPMVQEVAADADIRPERKAFINYWFRHVWEYISPLYPGIILASAITKISINTFLASQFLLTLAAIGAGVLFGFRGVHAGSVEGKRNLKELKTLFTSLFPIIASIVLVVVFKMPLAFAMVAVVVALFLYYRYRMNDVMTAIRESVSLNLILSIASIMVFKNMLEASGAIEALPVFFQQSGLPLGMVLFVLPFFVGLLTGVTMGFVGTTFPIITVMLGGSPDPGSVTFAFASGFAGMLLSPTHLCFLISIKYADADIAGMYRILFFPVLMVLLVGLIRLWM
jgi:integral membrane protein (TIGR00529 family)